MTGIKIKQGQFSGAGDIFKKGVLDDVIRGLAQDHARLRLQQFTDLTDSSTGAADYATGIVAQSGNTVAAFTETGTASAPKAGFDTAIGKVANAQAVLARYMNGINATIGLPLIVDSTGGTVATAGTIPALDKSTTAVSSNCLDVTTGRLRLETIKTNMRRLVGAANRIAVAVGETKITSAAGMKFDGGGDTTDTITLDAIAATGDAVDGTSDSTIANAVTNTELDTIADNIATIALFLNDIVGAQLADLTGNSNGTASDTTIAAMTIPSAAVDGAATTSSPKTGFDTAIANIEDSLAELTYRANWLLRKNNQTGLLTDSTGVTVNGALPDTAVNLTAVDGSSGTDAVDFTTGAARMTTIRNAVASIAAKVNVLCPLYGLPVLTDSSGGTAASTIENIAATGTGVGGNGTTILDTVADAFLLATCNNLETLKGRINTMLNSTNTGAQLQTTEALKVVAWDA